VLVFDEALGLLQHHLGHLHMAGRRLVEGGGDDLAAHGALHVRHLFRPLVDEQHDEIDLRVVVRDRMGHVLEHHGLAGAGRGDDERALALAERRDQLDDAGGVVLALVLALALVDLQMEALVGIERRQIVEIDAVADGLRVREIGLRDLGEREIALARLGRADLALHRVARAQAEAAQQLRRDIDVVGAGQVVGLRRAQEAEAVRQHLQNAAADNGDIVLRQALQDREHHVLLAQGGGVLDLELVGEREQLGRRLFLYFLEMRDLFGRRDIVEHDLGPSIR